MSLNAMSVELPVAASVTTGCTGMFRLRRRMRSDSAQHDRRREHLDMAAGLKGCSTLESSA